MESAIRNIPASFDQIASKLAGVDMPKVRRVVSLFSGCGGLDLGFMGGFEFGGKIYDRMPFEIIWANDKSSHACETYKRNLKHDIHCGDIWNNLESLPKRADVVVGGFPCQDVSINGSMAAENGSRSTLYKAMQEVIKRTRPRIFVAENVKGIMMSHSRAFYDEMMTGFEDIGYDATAHVYLSANYGVPQMRYRVFIVGTRKGKKGFEPPVATCPEAKWVTAKDALYDMEEVPEDKSISHIWSRAKESPEQGMRRLKADRPSTTIRAECHGNIQFHYKLARRLSMREAARLQSFPDKFIFPSGLRETERQIGNAVPPVLAWHMAKAVREYLE